jgi:acyl-CoA hydrolase
VKVGEVAVLRAEVEYVGRCSLEVGVRVYAEKPATGERALTLSSHLVFVKVDEQVKPVPVPQTVAPRGAAEEALHAAADARRARRLERFARRAERVSEVEDDAPEQLRWRFESCRAVPAEDTLFGNIMFAGKLLLDIDEAGGILSMRYCRGLVMTACLDALDFYAPISSNEVVTFKAGLNHVGTSSLEIGVKVLTEVPWTGEVKHACTAYLTYVHLGSDPGAKLRPQPCRPFTPETAAEQRRFAEALERRARRLERVVALRGAAMAGRGEPQASRADTGIEPSEYKRAVTEGR